MLKELKTIEELARSHRAFAQKGNITAPLHTRYADDLDAIANVLKKDAQAFQKCKQCNELRVLTHSKQYCSDKCRKESFRKKQKNQDHGKT